MSLKVIRLVRVVSLFGTCRCTSSCPNWSVANGIFVNLSLLILVRIFETTLLV